MTIESKMIYLLCMQLVSHDASGTPNTYKVDDDKKKSPINIMPTNTIPLKNTNVPTQPTKSYKKLAIAGPIIAPTPTANSTQPIQVSLS
ncbi:UNKNOWN [Stylonychia lemnae]|uniref:Uncharacterized protein n=1 Tax=Stylonychia lemnae TaxID=5949 RepID=A0A078B760_STYLE|nr:UNKNOWN [Stylonychia lemnae]|eukprot:CDW90031.1 UNKNOWN [Stylonychia lemnae]